MWDGVRNYTARNNLQAMKKGDEVLFYHSNEGLAVVGIAKVVKEAYQDPTTDEKAWVVVDLAPVRQLKIPVTLADMKGVPQLENLALIKQSRLSVSPVGDAEYKLIVKMGEGA